jgi:hypothetical protein
MSKEIKLSLLALVVLPALVMWFFWGRPATNATRESSSAYGLESMHDTAPGAVAMPATSPVAPLGSEGTAVVALEPPLPSSSAIGDGDARARLMLRHRPSVVKGTPLGCDPPYTIDVEGNKHYKKECF